MNSLTFLTAEQAVASARASGNGDFGIGDLMHLFHMGALSSLPSVDGDVVISSELNGALQNCPSPRVLSQTQGRQHLLFEEMSSSSLRIGNVGILALSRDSDHPSPELRAALRNLIENAAEANIDLNKAEDLDYVNGSRLSLYSSVLRDFAASQVKRTLGCESESASQFSRSAHYMGSKRALGAFVVEAISGPDNWQGHVVDLMCGSGATTGAFARVWPTISSDAQKFCQYLAKVQGGGFNKSKAESVLQRLLPVARDHFSQLSVKLKDVLSMEEDLLHSELDDELVFRYHDFVESTPLYPDRPGNSQWDPLLEVAKKKNGPENGLSLLFTCYFANVFFGVRQCAELDSLRHGISTLQNERERSWAMGALIASCSAIATTYGGHFAQPLIGKPGTLTRKKLRAVIERRVTSVFFDFSARLLALAEESPACKNEVSIVDGPWEVAIQNAAKLIDPNEPTTLYLDAPYTRDEYSRYYHVLETLVRYNYPTSSGQGRMPEKKTGERFRSAFFSRKTETVEAELAKIMRSALDRRWRVAWSYSDSGTAVASRVLETVVGETKATVRTYSTPYTYKAQSGSSAKDVTEYVFLIEAH